MQLKTILNHVQKYKSFVYEEARLIDEGDQPRIEVTIRARKNAQPRCGQCRQPGPRYGRLEPRRYEFVPLWGLTVFFVYARRRVNCPACGVKAEWVPWAEGNETLTKTYQWFLARWAGTAGLFRTIPPHMQAPAAEKAFRTNPRGGRGGCRGRRWPKRSARTGITCSARCGTR